MYLFLLANLLLHFPSSALIRDFFLKLNVRNKFTSMHEWSKWERLILLLWASQDLREILLEKKKINKKILHRNLDNCPLGR